jgi:hypothetical protein
MDWAVPEYLRKAHIPGQKPVDLDFLVKERWIYVAVLEFDSDVFASLDIVT